MVNNDHLPTLVPNRIDRDPAIISGITAPELYLIILAASPMGLLAVLVFGLVFRSLFVGVALGMAALILSLIAGVVFIANVKRDKPLHYLSHAWHVRREKMGFGPASFIHRTTTFRKTR